MRNYGTTELRNYGTRLKNGALIFSALLLCMSIQAQLNVENINTITNQNVGVHTSSPTASLHVVSPLVWKIEEQRDVLEGGGVTYYTGASSPAFLVESEYSLTLGGSPDGTRTKFIIKHNGSVGINTDNPSEMFHVNGSSKFADDSQFDEEVSITGLLQTSSDVSVGGGMEVMNNAGIGGSLDVQGSADVDSDLDVGGKSTLSNSTIVGYLEIQDPSNQENQIKLKPDGEIRARSVRVNEDNIPDYVFKDDYQLMTILELKEFIERHGHLPNIKSEEEYKAEGSVDLGELNMKLLEKIEELTLYTIQQEERLNQLENQLKTK